LWGQFELLEHALSTMGVVVWPMVELEADDALASAAAVAGAEASVAQVVICTPDKDLAQCVSDSRVVQLDRRSGQVFDEAGVRAKFGVAPGSIPDWLALVGDAADGFPGLAGWGRRSAATVLAHYGHIASVPDDVREWDPAVLRSVRGAASLAARLAEDRSLAELFCDLATLRIDPEVVGPVQALRWEGPTPQFEEVCGLLGDLTLFERASALSRS
jgi:5'-3' exonuclease